MSIDDDDEIYDVHDFPLADLINDVIDKDGYRLYTKVARSWHEAHELSHGQ